MKKCVLLLALCLSAMTVNAQRLLGGDISVLPNYEKDGTVYREQATAGRLQDLRQECPWFPEVAAAKLPAYPHFPTCHSLS